MFTLNHILNVFIISIVSISFVGCQVSPIDDDADSNTNTLNSEFNQDGSILTASGSENSNYAWKINDIHVGNGPTLDLKDITISPIQSVTLYSSDGEKVISKEMDVEFNNKPIASYEYDYINNQFVVTSTDPDGDDLTHKWIVNGELFSIADSINVDELPIDDYMHLSLASSDGNFESIINEFSYFYYDINVKHREFGRIIDSSGLDIGTGNPIYKIQNSEAGQFKITPSLLNLDPDIYLYSYITLYDTAGNFIDSANSSDSIYTDLDEGEYYLIVGIDRENVDIEFELEFSVIPDNSNTQVNFDVQLIQENQLDPFFITTTPSSSFTVIEGVATSNYVDPENRELTYIWKLNNETVSLDKSLELNDFDLDRELLISLEVTVADLKSSTSDRLYDFRYLDLQHVISTVENRFINSGIMHPLDKGNDIYELEVTTQSLFVFKSSLIYSSLCFYEDDIYYEDDYYYCDSELRLSLSPGKYTFIVDTYSIYAQRDYAFVVHSDNENSATLTLVEKGVDVGSFIGEGFALIDDDYLTDAKVCLDINANSVCDLDELDIYTDNDGYFSMTTEQFTRGSVDEIIIEVGDFGYVLKAFNQGDSTYITPISTLMKNYVLYVSDVLNYSNNIDPLNVIVDALGFETRWYLNTDYINYSSNDSYYDNFASQLLKYVSQIIYKDSLSHHQYFSEINSPASITLFEQYLAAKMLEQLPRVAQQISNLILNESINTQQLNQISFDININKLIAHVERVYLDINNGPKILAYGEYGNYFKEFKLDLNLINGFNYTHQANDWGGHHNLLTANLESGQGDEDLVLIDTGMLNGYINTISDNGEETFVDLTSEFAKYKNDFAEYAVKQGQDHLGRQKAIPLDLGPGVAFYRRDYMEDLGFDIDIVMHSWDTFISYGEHLKENHDTYLVSNSDGIARAMIYGNTPENTGVFIHNDQILVETQKFKNAFAMAKQIRDKGLDANTGMWNDNWYNGFRHGKFAMEIQGAWMLGHIQAWIAPDTTGKWGMSSLPNGLNSSWGGTFVAIPKYAEDKKEEAWKVIEFMINPEYQLKAFKQWAMFPTNTSTYSDAYFDEPIEFLNGQAARRIVANVAKDIVPTKPGQFDNIAETLVINEALQFVLNGEKSIDDALSDAAEELEIRMNQ
ncbi:MAG: extracellular solute-binding protein [Saccharospirillaceae bacterium]|nr:extracellular solute-binding protein [Pseudomonadales bacterium]NRB80408.1 extracellular solute-binding protein [Saccharospirillaceae bacterium]